MVRQTFSGFLRQAQDRLFDSTSLPALRDRSVPLKMTALKIIKVQIH